jgi:ADP-ribose pyrophosphatase YjhB (NUDIX family)
MKHTDLEFSDWTPPRQVRAVALAVVRNDDRILMQESVDIANALTVYRPVGGTIEFLESGEKTVIREFREELAIELVDVLYLGTIESIGESVRGPWHEIIMLYEASFADHANYDVASFNSLPGSGMRYTTRWLTLSEIESIPGSIHPHNLLSLLRSKAGQRPKS